MQRRLLVAGVALLAALAAIVTGCGRKASNDVIARVNGADITREQVMKVLEQQDNGQMGLRALDAVIVDQLIRQKAKERKITASQTEIDQRIAPMKDIVLAETGQTWDQWLAATGQSLDDIREGVSLQILTSKLLIPEADMKKFFEANQDKLKDVPYNNESVIYRRLVVATKTEAEALRKQLGTATDEAFAKLAKEKSVDPITRGRSGMVGWLVKGKEVPEEKELGKVIFSLKPGEVSQPLSFRSPAGSAQPGAPTPPAGPEQWQLVEVVKHIPPHALRLEDNQDQVEKAMLQSNMQLAMTAQEFFNDLQSKAKIEILNARYKPLEEQYKQRAEQAAQMKAMGGAAGMPGVGPGEAMPMPQGAPPAPSGK